MSEAIVLACPSCERSFLTLQQAPLALEVCPYCAHAGPQSRFRLAKPSEESVAPLVMAPPTLPPSSIAVAAVAPPPEPASLESPAPAVVHPALAKPPVPAPSASSQFYIPPPPPSVAVPQAPVVSPAQPTVRMAYIDPQSPLGAFLRAASDELAAKSAALAPPSCLPVERASFATPALPRSEAPLPASQIPIPIPLPQSAVPSLAPAFVPPMTPAQAGPLPVAARPMGGVSEFATVSPQALSGISPFAVASVAPSSPPSPLPASPASSVSRDVPPPIAPPPADAPPRPSFPPPPQEPVRAAVAPGPAPAAAKAEPPPEASPAEPPPFQQSRKGSAKDFPVWPGLGAREMAHAGAAPASPINPVAAGMRANGKKKSTIMGGPKIPWWVIVGTLLGAACLLWAFLEKSPVTLSFPTDPNLDKKANAGPVETRRALLKDEAFTPSYGDSKSRAWAIAHVLERASKIEDRLAVVADAETQRGAVEAFFKVNEPGWHVDSVQAGPRVIELATAHEAPLFRAMTSNCPDGALMHLVENPAGPALLDWPLFAACEAAGAEQKPEAAPQPGWNTFLFQRLPAASEALPPFNQYERVHLQVTLKDASGFNAYARKDSPLGMALMSIFRQGQWGLGTLLVAEGQIDGKTILILQDFRGAGAAPR